MQLMAEMVVHITSRLGWKTSRHGGLEQSREGASQNLIHPLLVHDRRDECFWRRALPIASVRVRSRWRDYDDNIAVERGKNPNLNRCVFGGGIYIGKSLDHDLEL